MATEKLIVELDARTAKIDAKLKSTDDKLGKLSRSTDSADSKLSKMSGTAKSVGTALGVATVAVTALTAGTVALIKQTTEYGRELKIASQLSGIATDKLQAMAFATSTVGINIEKLGDISKDTREKIGDFLNTGGGGFQDFADAMRLTKEEAALVAEEFSHMSGPDILQEMVTRMEAADVSAVQMSHALEGMASDTTNLIPLLLEGGRGMERLSSAMDGVTVPLTDEDLQKLADLDAAISLAAESASSLANQTLVNLSDWFINAANAASFFFASLNEGSKADLLTKLLPITEEIQEIEEKLKGAGGSEEVRLERMLEKLVVEREAIADALAELNKKAEEPEMQSTKSVKGVDATGTANEKEKALQMLIDRFKSEEEILTEKYAKEVELAKGNKDLLFQLDKEYKEKLAELNKNNSLDAIAERFKSEEVLLREKLERELEIVGKNNELKKQLHREYTENLLAIESAANEKAAKAKEKADKKAQKDIDKQKKIDDAIVKANKDRDDQAASDSMALASMLFENNKAIGAGVIVAETAQNVVTSVKNSGGVPWGLPAGAAAAAMGIAQLSALKGASKGGGSISSGGVSAPATQQPEPIEQSSLSLTTQDENGSNELVVRFATDSGDDYLDMLANSLNQRNRQGR